MNDPKAHPLQDWLDARGAVADRFEHSETPENRQRFRDEVRMELEKQAQKDAHDDDTAGR